MQIFRANRHALYVAYDILRKMRENCGFFIQQDHHLVDSSDENALMKKMSERMRSDWQFSTLFAREKSQALLHFTANMEKDVSTVFVQLDRDYDVAQMKFPENLTDQYIFPSDMKPTTIIQVRNFDLAIFVSNK